MPRETLDWLDRQARYFLGPHGYQAVSGINELFNPVPGLMDAVTAPGRMVRGEVDPVTGMTQVAGGLLDAVPGPGGEVAAAVGKAVPVMGLLGAMKGPGWLPERVFRGEHGPVTDAPFQTRSGSLTFIDTPGGASLYARYPNADDIPVAPRVYPAQVNIKKPIFEQRNADPFVEFEDVAKALGEDKALAYFKKHAAAAENTGNWIERIDPNNEFGSVVKFLDKHPERANELYMEAYELLDDADFIADARRAGYDGAIYGGSGETAGDIEYRVFSPDQAVPMFDRDKWADPAHRAKYLDRQYGHAYDDAYED